REGVAEDRIVSVGDPDVRHGRQTRTQTINGYKRHIAVANGFTVVTAGVPPNRREHEPTGQLHKHVLRHGKLSSLEIDRGYLPSPEVAALWRADVKIRSRPWRVRNKGLFVKEDFHIDLDARGVVCPAGCTARINKCGTV